MPEIPDISPELIIQAAESIYLLGKEVHAGEIARFMDLSDNYAEKAVRAGVELGIIKQSSSGKYLPQEATVLFVSAKRANHPALFRTYLERFEPFVFFKERVMRQVDLLQASREVKNRFSVGSDPHVIRDSLINWGTYAGALRRDEHNVITCTTTDFLVEAGPSVICEHFSQRAEVEKFIRTYWTDKTNDVVPRRTVDYLVDAYLKTVNEAPFRETILLIGNAFEDFLKHIAGMDPPVDLTGCSGIMTIGERLKSNGRVAGKHLAYTSFIGHLRNAADHGIDNDIGREWDVRRQTVSTLNYIAWGAIESIAVYQEGTARL